MTMGICGSHGQSRTTALKRCHLWQFFPAGNERNSVLSLSLYILWRISVFTGPIHSGLFRCSNRMKNNECRLVRRDKSFSLSVSVNLRVSLYLVTGLRSAAIRRFSEEGHANDTWRTCLIICGIMVRMPDEARLPWVMYEGRGEWDKGRQSRSPPADYRTAVRWIAWVWPLQMAQMGLFISPLQHSRHSLI